LANFAPVLKRDMAKEKPSAPQGMRDFGPDEMVRRNYIFNTIRKVYEKYGYVQIETPAMEKLETLTGKYGEEGDRLIFKVLNSGDYLKDLKEANIDWDSKKGTKYISEKALKYDLTVPFARFVVQYFNDLKLPFKRYQIQPVWRADRPQKGRYREFYQCDADVVGSDSLINEIEFVQIYNEVLNGLKLTPYIVKINHRKILSGFAEVIGSQDKLIPFTIALDKLDKIGKEKVLDELRTKEFSEEQLQKISSILDINGTTKEKLSFLKTYFANSEAGLKGVEEIEKVFSVSEELGIQNGNLELDLTLARGLDYYTGCIFEATIPGAGMGSISGGGRYDDLTGIFGMTGLSGVGISFGADRIYDILLAQNLFPVFNENKIQFLFLNFGEAEAMLSLKLVQELRKNGVIAAVYPDSVKPKKQFQYANDLGVTNVCMIGSDELQNGTVSVKNMETGDQVSITVEEFKTRFIN
jgi:histidyl-tRNA synthetase